MGCSPSQRRSATRRQAGALSCCGASGPDPENWLQEPSLGSASHFQTCSQRQILGLAGKPSWDQQDKGASTGLPVASPGRDQRQGLKQTGVAPTRPPQLFPRSPIPGHSCPVSEVAAEYKQADTMWGASSDTANGNYILSTLERLGAN